MGVVSSITQRTVTETISTVTRWGDEPEVIYNPRSMVFDGTTGYYKITGLTETPSVLTCVVRFKCPPKAGESSRQVVEATGDSGGSAIGMVVLGADNAHSPNKLYVDCATTTTLLYRTASKVVVADNQWHTVVLSFNSAGQASFYIDGVDADDTDYYIRVAPTAGTIAPITRYSLAAYANGGGWLNGAINYTGLHDVYIADPTVFDHPTNGLQELDEATWTEWTSQPLFWHDEGTMTANKGTAGNMTVYGTITGPVIG